MLWETSWVGSGQYDRLAVGETHGDALGDILVFLWKG